MHPRCEFLESRTFLSASPAVAADRAEIINDHAVITRDTVTCRTAIAAMHASIPAARASVLAMLHADQLKLRQDRGNVVLVDQDRAKILLDQSTLKNEVQTLQNNIKAEQSHCKDLIAADRSLLKAHQLQLRNDLRA